MFLFLSCEYIESAPWDEDIRFVRRKHSPCGTEIFILQDGNIRPVRQKYSSRGIKQIVS